MKRTIWVTLPLLLIFGCSEQRSVGPGPQTAFTMTTGVSVVSMSGCSAPEERQGASLKTLRSSQLVSVVATFRCEGAGVKPFLTVVNGHKATLVLNQETAKAVFASTCECFRSLDVSIEGRLEPGDTLYVLSDYEVIGHVQVP